MCGIEHEHADFVVKSRGDVFLLLRKDMFIPLWLWEAQIGVWLVGWERIGLDLETWDAEGPGGH